MTMTNDEAAIRQLINAIKAAEIHIDALKSRIVKGDSAAYELSQELHRATSELRYNINGPDLSVRESLYWESRRSKATTAA